MDLTLIIPTRNRSERLVPLFNALVEQEIPGSIDWEILIIDNGSADDTPIFLKEESRRKRLPLKILNAPVPGKSRALNLGISKAAGNLVVFTDDDVKPVSCWLFAFLEAANKYEKNAGFGGRVEPMWEGPLPKWLIDNGLDILPKGLINKKDYGTDTIELPFGIVPGGGNVALRKKWIMKMGFFREDLGPGTELPYAEDTEFMLRLNKMGMNYRYVPDALIYHRNCADRMTISYATTWMRQVARSQIVALHSNSDFSSFWGVPRYLFRRALLDCAAWVCAGGPRTRIKTKLSFFKTIGEIEGFRKLRQMNSIR